MSDQLKEKTSSALFWSFIDKGGQQVIQLVFMIVLARLLEPEEIGFITVLTIFTTVANLLQESGFSLALIRKKDADETDYSTVFYFNIFTSIVLYAILFACAPLISSFYRIPILTGLSRFMFLAFVFNSFSIIQNVHLVRKMDFRTNAQITFTSWIISGMVAVVMAFNGYGAWSLAAQLVLQSFIRSPLLWFYVKWRPRTGFVLARLKAIFPYSFNLLLTWVFNQIASNLYPMIIGKCFSMSQAGYYGQAYKLIYIPQSIISSSLQGVAYPVLTKIEEQERMKRIFRKIIRVTSFISFPILSLMVIAAEPIISIVLSDKWLPAAPLLQILAIGAVIYPMHCIFNSLAQALGKSSIILKVEVFRNIISVLLIFASINYGIHMMTLGMSLSAIIGFTAAFLLNKKSISYSLTEILKDILPYSAISVCIFLPLYFLKAYIDNNFLLLGVQTIAGFGLYLLAVKVLGSKVFEESVEFLKNKKFK